ncbi:molybdopterin-guanine dinucleotide biosynthesis protein MobB [Bradyrhizobium sp. LB9.1b]
MKVIGLAGWSGAGKTTLLTRLIPHFNAQGLRVSVIKHAHHQFDVDVPGKDSWRHREARRGRGAGGFVKSLGPDA